MMIYGWTSRKRTGATIESQLLVLHVLRVLVGSSVHLTPMINRINQNITSSAGHRGSNSAVITCRNSKHFQQKQLRTGFAPPKVQVQSQWKIIFLYAFPGVGRCCFLLRASVGCLRWRTSIRIPTMLHPNAPWVGYGTSVWIRLDMFGFNAFRRVFNNLKRVRFLGLGPLCHGPSWIALAAARVADSQDLQQLESTTPPALGTFQKQIVVDWNTNSNMEISSYQ